MRAKFVNADGGWQYRNIPRVDPEIQYAVMPRLRLNEPSLDTSVAIQVRKRRFEYYGKNENGIIEYREIVE